MKMRDLMVPAVLVIGAVLLGRQWQTTTELRHEVAALRAEMRPLAAAREHGTKAASAATVGEAGSTLARESDRAELARLREELERQIKRADDFNRQAQAARAVEVARAPAVRPAGASVANLIPVSAWRNAGKDTPTATTETLLWAAAGGDVDLLAQTIVLNDTGMAKAKVWFARLSNSTRAEYVTPEKLIALMVAKEGALVTGMQILDQRETATDEAGLRMRFSNETGETKEQKYLLRRGADGWRMVVPDAAVDKYEKQLLGKGQ